MAESRATKSSQNKNGEREQEHSTEQVRQPMLSGPHADILRLQQTIGNQAVMQLLSNPISNGALIQRKCASCREEEHYIQRKADANLTSPPTETGIPPSVLSALQGRGGNPLNSATRALMESRFNHNFSQVRIHTDETAAQAAKAINAAAFTFGNSVWFGRGRYDPNRSEGQHLLAHELAHVIQQKRARPSMQRDLLIGQSNDPSEALADRAADAVLQNKTVPHLTATKPAIRREELPLSPPRPRLRLQEREPAVTPSENNPNEVFVTHNGNRYRVVRRFAGLVPHEETIESDQPPEFGVGADRNNVWMQVDWCTSGGRSTEGRVRLGANVPQAGLGVLRRAGQAVLRGDDPSSAFEDVDLTVFLETEIARSESFELRGRAELTTDPFAGEVTGGRVGVRGRVPLGRTVVEPFIDFGANRVDVPGGRERTDIRVTGGVEIPLGERPREVRCNEYEVVTYTPRYEYACFEEIPARQPTLRETRFIYFEFERDVVERRPNEPGTPLNQQEIQELEANLRDGFQVTSIRGRTSPEGLRQLPGRPPGRFAGNDPLSEDRAEAARSLVELRCNSVGRTSQLGMRQPNCFASNVPVTGEGELHTLTETRNVRGRPQEVEVEGKRLATHAAGQFLQSEVEERHRTPELEEQIRQATPQRQGELVFPLLRRAEITLTKQEQIPAESQRLERCPPAVQEAARLWFRRSRSVRSSRRRLPRGGRRP